MVKHLTFDELKAMDLAGWQCVIEMYKPTTRAIIEKVIAHDNPRQLEFVFVGGRADVHQYPEMTWLLNGVDLASVFVPDKEDFDAIQYSRGHITFFVVDVGSFRLLPKGSKPYEVIIGYALTGELHSSA